DPGGTHARRDRLRIAVRALLSAAVVAGAGRSVDRTDRGDLRRARARGTDRAGTLDRRRLAGAPVLAVPPIASHRRRRGLADIACRAPRVAVGRTPGPRAVVG